jgi:hypothetical protein
MRISTIAIAAALAVAVAVPASAATKKHHHTTTTKAQAGTPGLDHGTFEQCEARSIQLGTPAGQTGHTEYVRQCMGLRYKARPTGGGGGGNG